jgi:acid phosphatase type 7
MRRLPRRPWPLIILAVAVVVVVALGAAWIAFARTAAPPPTAAVPVATPGAGATDGVTRGPYLQDGSDTSMTFLWSTTAPSPGGVAVSAAGGASPVAAHEAAPATDHHVRLTGLRPGSVYTYTLLAGADPLGGAHSFHTAPAAGAAAPFTFDVWGDSGCGCPQQTSIAAALAATQPDLLLHTGDLIYEGGEARLFDSRFFAPYRATLASAPFYPTLGNHDMVTDAGGPWLRAFALPGDNGTHTTRYYSFNYGSAHFVALDSEEDWGPTSAQYSWLLRDLESPAAQQATWRFAYMHRPPYSSGLGHGSEYALREAWSPLFERFGVDIVFAGHEHNYERSAPVRDYTAVGGRFPVVYIVTGGGGKQLYEVGRSPWTAFSAMVYHFVRVDVSGRHIRVQAVNAEGQVFDQAEWDRP